MNGLAERYSPERHLELEGLNPATYEGFSLGDRVAFTRRIADDIDAGQVAILYAMDDHPVFPLTVVVQKPAGQDYLMPVGLDEVAISR